MYKRLCNIRNQLRFDNLQEIVLWLAVTGSDRWNPLEADPSVFPCFDKSMGVKDKDAFQESLWNGSWRCMILAAVMALQRNNLIYVLMNLSNTPSDIYTDAARYIRILFSVIPITSAL